MGEPQRNWVVVTMGGESGCGVSHCPMGADGPFTHEEAKAYLQRTPERLHPHLVVLTPPVAEPMNWGDFAGVDRTLRAGLAPNLVEDCKISTGPGPSPDTLEVLAEQGAAPAVVSVLAAAGYPVRSEPVTRERREAARIADPTSVAAADDVLSIIVSRPQ